MVHKVSADGPQPDLHNNRLFAGIPAELINEIGAHMELLRFDAGDVIFEEGEPGDCLYLVCSGVIAISKLGRGGKQETLGMIQPGNFFGEMSLIDGQPRSAQAAAAEGTVLGRVDHATFDRILAIAPRDLHMNFLRSVVERLRGINSQFITEVMRTERLALVGSMANSIVHDLKNPICVIRSCTDLLARRVKDPAVAEFTQLMNRAVDNMLDMTQEMLDFARGKSSLQPTRVTVRAVVNELDAQMARLLPDTIHLMRETDCAGEIMADPGRFARMLLNLVKNSIEAMADGGILRIAVRKQARQIIFRISDTGCGIDAELQAKIFEPFVTFGKSKGTGLGMAIVKNVVEAHSGTIALHSEIGVGTSIEVSVPELPPE